MDRTAGFGDRLRSGTLGTRVASGEEAIPRVRPIELVAPRRAKKSATARALKPVLVVSPAAKGTKTRLKSTDIVSPAAPTEPDGQGGRDALKPRAVRGRRGHNAHATQPSLVAPAAISADQRAAEDQTARVGKRRRGRRCVEAQVACAAPAEIPADHTRGERPGAVVGRGGRGQLNDDAHRRDAAPATDSADHVSHDRQRVGVGRGRRGRTNGAAHTRVAPPAAASKTGDHKTHDNQRCGVAESGRDHFCAANRPAGVAPAATPDGQPPLETQAIRSVGGEGGQPQGETLDDLAALAEICADIRNQWRLHQAWHRAEKSLTLQAKAMCRRLAGGDKDEGNRIFAAAWEKKGEHPLALEAVMATGPFIEARKLIHQRRAPIEAHLEKQGKRLPVWQWANDIRGAGAKGLAQIVGEATTGDAGDLRHLSHYPNPAKLWKRLGLAPYDGHAMSTWKRETWRPRALTAEEWVANPFKGERYAVIWNIASAMFKAQWISKAKDPAGVGKPNGPYAEIYARRRAHTAQTHPDWKDGHAHNDALRIMVKAFVADLWAAWRNT